ncbi:MAG TPA: hypothetical protein PLO51_03430, partial [Candidatus Micrarchaeota archaeon]|nr:hypothetical protein [Candidatus Micrarchaeota archaeon]
DYINIATLNFILPVGIFFRAFAPTRQFGGAMIGLALGLFIFYPLMLVFNDYAIRDAMNQTRADTVDKIVGNYQSGYPTNQASAETARSDATGNLLSQATPDSSGNIQAAQNVSTMVYGIVRIAFNVFIASVVLVAINFAVLITVVKELSKLFGEEVDVASLTRMI